MTTLKTQPTGESVDAFLNGITDEKLRRASFTVLELMQAATGSQPQMWGNSIVGFGSYRYKYASGREGEWFLTGFAPRKQNLTLYIMSGFDDYETLLEKLGKYKTGKACLYIRSIQEIDLPTLQTLIERSVQHMAGADRGQTNA